MLLTGLLSEIEQFIIDEFEVDMSKHESVAFNYLINNSNWQLQEISNGKSGLRISRR